MPAFITHCLFAEEVLESIDFEKIQSLNIKKEVALRNPLYMLGAQGPDIFFFYKAKPWQKYDGIEKLAMMMHDSRTGDFFSESAEYLRTYLKAGSRFYSILAYLLGYICHYSLDRNAHPLIHYKSGIDTKKDRSTHKYHNYHKRYEAILDVYMLKKIKGLDAYKFNTVQLIYTDGKYNETLKSFYFYIVNRVYKIDISEKQVEIALQDTFSILNALHDPNGAKSAVFRAIEKIYGKEDDILSLIYPRNIDSYGDFLNLENKNWVHPCDKNLSCTKSFADIYNDAKNEAVNLAEDFISYAANTTHKLDFFKKFNFSYATGLDCETAEDLRYFDCIFDKTGKSL